MLTNLAVAEKEFTYEILVHERNLVGNYRGNSL